MSRPRVAPDALLQLLKGTAVVVSRDSTAIAHLQFLASAVRFFPLPVSNETTLSEYYCFNTNIKRIRLSPRLLI